MSFQLNVVYVRWRDGAPFKNDYWIHWNATHHMEIKFVHCDDYQKDWINQINRIKMILLTTVDVDSECRIYDRAEPQPFDVSMTILQILEPFLPTFIRQKLAWFFRLADFSLIIFFCNWIQFLFYHFSVGIITLFGPWKFSWSESRSKASVTQTPKFVKCKEFDNQKWSVQARFVSVNSIVSK